jgi:phospho-N-acetylmuramoyl-pentapeptide-transferase
VRDIVASLREEIKPVPTAGGIAIIISICLNAIFMSIIDDSFALNANTIAMLLLCVGYSVLGFADDVLKIARETHNGVTRNTRLFFEILMAIAFVSYIIWLDPSRNYIPIISHFINWTPLNVLWGAWIILSCANSMNLTDGIDALAGSVASYIFFFALFIVSSTQFTLPFAVLGALFGFLYYNRPPARIYMGDTGALGIGALIGGLYYVAQAELWLPLIGIVLIAETVTSIIQIFCIRKWNYRPFLMSPLHHHFEKLGWSRITILAVFNIISCFALLFCLLLKKIGL